MNWLPDMDLNHDKQIQSLLCYRYTIGQTSALKVECSPMESRLVQVPERQAMEAIGADASSAFDRAWVTGGSAIPIPK